MLKVLEHSVLNSLQTLRRTPSFSLVYFDHHSTQHLRIPPQQLGDVSRIVVHLMLFEGVAVFEQNRDSVYRCYQLE